MMKETKLKSTLTAKSCFVAEDDGDRQDLIKMKR